MTAFILTGCSLSLSYSSLNGKTTVEVNKLNDGESEKIGSVSVEEAAVLEPSMNKGALKIDFTKDNGSVADSVTVDNSDKQGISLEKGEYTVQVTTVGVTTGNVIDQ